MLVGRHVTGTEPTMNKENRSIWLIVAILVPLILGLFFYVRKKANLGDEHLIRVEQKIDDISQKLDHIVKSK